MTGSDRHELVLTPSHHRVEVAEPYVPGATRVLLRNKMRKRSAMFDVGSRILSITLRRRRSADPYLRPQDLSDWHALPARLDQPTVAVLAKLLTTTARLPERQTSGAAAFDLRADASLTLAPGERVAIATGLAIAIPSGYAGKILGRSGHALRGLDAHPGLIDPDYRGELKVILVNRSDADFRVRVGDRIAQLSIEPVAQATIQETAADLNITQRGVDGFGSTGISAVTLRPRPCRPTGSNTVPVASRRLPAPSVPSIDIPVDPPADKIIDVAVDPTIDQPADQTIGPPADSIDSARGAPVDTDRSVTPSACPRDRTNWKVNPRIFAQLDKLWGPHTVDLFSGPRNGQLHRRFTITPGDTTAAAVDAFKQDWTTENGWANPPFDHDSFRRLVDKTIVDQAELTVIAPVWRKAPWFQDLVALSIDYPRLLPNDPDLFLPGPTNTFGVGKPPWLETAAFRISGKAPSQADFSSRLRTKSLPPTVRAAGYRHGRKLPFFHLHSAVPVRFDSKLHASDTSLELHASPTHLADDGFETIHFSPAERRKAYAMVTANGCHHLCLFDSGSHVDQMSWNFYRKYCRRLPLQPFNGYLRAFNGSPSVPAGIVQVRVKMGNRCVRIPFLVIRDALDDLLIGETTMDQIGVDIINTKRLVRISGGARAQPTDIPIVPGPAPTSPQPGRRNHKLRAVQSITLPPWSAAYIDVTAPEATTSSTFLAESLPNSSAVHVMRGIVAPNGKHISINVANLTSRPRQVHQGQAVGICSGITMADYDVTQVFDDEYDPFDASPSITVDISNAETYAITKASLEKEAEVTISNRTVREFRDSRPAVNWAGIPMDLNIGQGVDPLADNQLNCLTDLIRRQQERGMFSTARNPGQVRPDIAMHHIDTGDAKPRAFPPRRVSAEKRAAIQKEMDTMKAAGVIRPSRSPWAAPVVLAAKKDGGVRFCVDYRELNKLTKRDVYPLPRIDDTVDALNGAKYLTAFDMLSGYWQVPLSPEDAPKTAFVTHEGLFEWTCMPFGLTGAPATFQRMMDTVLAGLKWQCCLVYLDDVVVFSRTFDTHLRDLQLVFDRLHEAGLKLKPSKCFFCCTELLYLGYLVTPDGLKPDPTTKRAILAYPVPTDVSGVRTFLGMTGHYRQFIPRYAMIAEPLQKLTKPSVPWQWAEAQQQAFSQLQQLLTEPPVLKLPDFSRKFQFTLQTDASDAGLGAVLCQKGEDNKLHPVAFASRRLTDSELKYHTQEKEALAIIWACEKFRPYLMGETFDVETDHGSLKWLLGTQKGRLARWAMRLSEFDLRIKPKPGRANGNADAPSRYPVDDPDHNWTPEGSAPYYTDLIGSSIDFLSSMPTYLCNISTEDAAAQVTITTIDLPVDAEISATDTSESPPLTQTLRQKLITSQRQDPAVTAIIRYLNKETATCLLPQGTKTEYTSSLIERMRLEPDGLLTIRTPYYVPGQPLRKSRKKGRSFTRTDIPQLLQTHRAVVPSATQGDLLKIAHASPVAGHLGKNKVYDILTRDFFWKGMSQDVKDFIRSCAQCQRFKNAPRPWLKPLRPIGAEAPFSRVAVDLITDLPESAGHRFKHVAVFTDMFTKWPEAAPLREKSAKAVADALFQRIICQHGIPQQLQSDQGPEFVNDIIARLTDRMEICHVTTTPYNPSSNGAVEQFNKTLVHSLRKYIVDENPMNWDQFIDGVLFAYRVSKHAATQFSPFELLYGRQPRLPTSILMPEDIEFTRDIKEYNTRHVYELHRAHQCVKALLADARDLYKAYHDGKASQRAIQPAFVVGDEVMLYSPRLRTSGEHETTTTKFRPQWNGPFVIVEISDTGDVFTIRDDRNRILRVKLRDLKRFYRSIEPVFDKRASAGGPAINPPNGPGPRAQPSPPVSQPSSSTVPSAAAMSAPSAQQPTNTHQPLLDMNPSAEDPNRSYEVDRILRHRRWRNKYLYLVRWAQPFNDPKWDCEIDDRAFNRPANSKLPPALIEYWLQSPPPDRPAAYRSITRDLSSDSTTNPSADAASAQPTKGTKRGRRNKHPSGNKRRKQV